MGSGHEFARFRVGADDASRVDEKAGDSLGSLALLRRELTFASPERCLRNDAPL
jgi:hypothetical protein